MRVDVTPLNGQIVRCLFITQREWDEAHPCENCGKRKVLNHPDLAKEIDDWCLECNDNEMRKNWTDVDFMRYCFEQSAKGKAVIIAMEREYR